MTSVNDASLAVRDVKNVERAALANRVQPGGQVAHLPVCDGLGEAFPKGGVSQRHPHGRAPLVVELPGGVQVLLNAILGLVAQVPPQQIRPDHRGNASGNRNHREHAEQNSAIQFHDLASTGAPYCTPLTNRFNHQLHSVYGLGIPL